MNPKKKRFCLAALAMLAIGAAASAWAEGPAALLLSCKGEVTVVRQDGSTVRGSYGLPLGPGDEVRTAAGAEAEINFENGTWISVGPASSALIKSASMKKPAAEESQARTSFESVNTFLKLRESEGVSLAGLRSASKAPDITLESPCQTTIAAERPRFSWRASDTACALRLKLYDDKGVRWQRDVAHATSIDYPADAEPLKPGVTYSWTLETTDPLKFPPLRSQAGFFEIIAPDEAASLEASLASIDRKALPSESAYRLVRASLYFRHKLMDEAIGETRAALELDPDNASLHAILGRLYAETGRTYEAMAEYDKILEKR
jgi:hypothetical protein